MRRLLMLLCALLLLPSLAAAQAQAREAQGRHGHRHRQVGLPIALERGFFEKHGLDVTIARPYATGVDALNALQAGESDIVQVGVPMIGAVLRGMDLVRSAITAATPPSSAPTPRWRSSPARTRASSRAT